MRVININDHLTGFYFAGDSIAWGGDPAEGMDDNWSLGGCNSLGVCCYVLHSKGEALVYDTLCSPEQIGEVRACLEERGISRFTVTLSHWHLDHVGGNNVFKDCNIIATEKTRQALALHQDAIERGELWGEPPIKPLRLPDVVYKHELTVYVGDFEARLRNINIHTDDGAFLYLPQDKLLLAGDMLEDTCPFITNPRDIPVHLENLAALRGMDFTAIYPNHGSCNTVSKGGYTKEFIDAAAYYLEKMHATVSADLNCPEPDLSAFAAKYLEKGVIRYWGPYEVVHKGNFERMKLALSNPDWDISEGL